MPTYEYRCPRGHEFELFQRMSDEPRAGCPTCGDEASRLLSGGAGFLFKGEGFYITDYRSDAYRAAARKEEGGASSPSGTPAATPGAATPASATSGKSTSSGATPSSGTSASGPSTSSAPSSSSSD